MIVEVQHSSLHLFSLNDHLSSSPVSSSDTTLAQAQAAKLATTQSSSESVSISNAACSGVVGSSTGSRIHIYKFNNCGPSPGYKYEVFKQRQPGLSDYSYVPSAMAESLDVLLDEAMPIVPEPLRKCTPIAVKATAGLRLLGDAESAAILAAVRQRVKDKYPYSLQGGADSAVIMDGHNEGVYACIMANYLLDTIRNSSPAGTEPYMVLDLGGASSQIVFEPTFKIVQPRVWGEDAHAVPALVSQVRAHACARERAQGCTVYERAAWEEPRQGHAAARRDRGQAARREVQHHDSRCGHW